MPPDGETITIDFDGTPPTSLTLSAFILREDGDAKYHLPGKVLPLHFGSPDSVGSFAVEPNVSTAFSSDSHDYEAGNTIKGYRLVCAWGKNECEYAFILRGDTAVAAAETALGE